MRCRVATNDTSTVTEEVESICESEILEFLNEKSVFVTGAAGFVGAILLETLLRCCPGIQNIYILLREKKGVLPEKRKEQIFKKSIFLKLKAENEDVFKKVHVVSGDVTQPDLGMNEADRQKVVDDVAVVFHCAAVISFMRPLKYMVIQNAMGTYNVLQLCKKLPKIKAFVHTSTAYCNCNKQGVIEEKVYELPVPAKKFLDVVGSETMDETSIDKALESMQKQCLPAWPNTYTLTKAIAESILLDEREDIPIAIVRPSIVVSTWKGPLPGYTEEGAGIIDISIGIGKGFIRVLYCDEQKIVDVIPVDVVVNTLIAAAFTVGTKRDQSPMVVHCTSGEMAPCTWGRFIRGLYRLQEKYPLPRMYQKPSLVMRKNRVAYWMSAFVNHYAPAMCIDLILLTMRKKPKLTKLYRFYDNALHYLGYFLTNDWKFECNTYKSLIHQQNKKDAELFPLDIQDYALEEACQSLTRGAPFYQWETDTKPYKDRMPLAYRRYALTTFIKWTAILWSMLIIAFVITRVV